MLEERQLILLVDELDEHRAALPPLLGAQQECTPLDGDLAPIETYAGGKYKVGDQWFRAAQLPFYGADALRAARDVHGTPRAPPRRSRASRTRRPS